MLAPVVVVVAVFLGWPTIWTFFLSLTDMTLTGPTATHYHYVGLANYRELFASGSGLVHSVLASLAYLAGSAYVGQALLGFTLAYLMQWCALPVRTVVGGIVVMAWLVPEIVCAWMWFALLASGGTLQHGLQAVGLPYQTWLVTHPMLSVNLANSWRGAAFSYLLFAAALSDVPTDLLETAAVDGANLWHRLTKVVIPLLSTAILVDLVLITLGTLNDFTLIFAMTGGGPGDASNVLSVFMYRQAFVTFQLAFGTAIAIVMLAVGGLFAVLYVHLLRRQGALGLAR
jgi:multiple sugar transport system permease protein